MAILCDNAGKNVKLKEKINKLQYGIDFEMMAAGTPQHNGVVERAFATLHGRIRATLNMAKLTESLHGWLWAECALVDIKVHNLLIDKYDKK